MSDYFRYQIHFTTFNICFDIFSQVWGIVFLANELLSFFNSKKIYKMVNIISVDEYEINDF